MKIPEKVIILDQQYKITILPEDHMEGIMGLCRSDDCAIDLRDGMTTDKQGEVFLHEVIHAVGETLNLKLTENQVNSLGVGLFGFLRRNKINWYKSKKAV